MNFTIRHLGIAKVRGRFSEVKAELYVGESADDIRVSAEIALASIDTGNATVTHTPAPPNCSTWRAARR